MRAGESAAVRLFCLFLPKATLVGHRSSAHGMLQTRDGTPVAQARCAITHVHSVIFDEAIELVAAGIEGACKVQRYVGSVISLGLAELICPLVKELPFVGSLFRHRDWFFVHKSDVLLVRFEIGCFE